jgi:hypothetical protein
VFSQSSIDGDFQWFGSPGGGQPKNLSVFAGEVFKSGKVRIVLEPVPGQPVENFRSGVKQNSFGRKNHLEQSLPSDCRISLRIGGFQRVFGNGLN